jgi:hypothetical protein
MAGQKQKPTFNFKHIFKAVFPFFSHFGRIEPQKYLAKSGNKVTFLFD